MVYYLFESRDGLKIAESAGDGYSIHLKWNIAYPSNVANKVAYNIYMSNTPMPNSNVGPVFPTDFFDNSPAFVSIDGTAEVDIVDLIPGEMYWFAVRAFEYDPNSFNFSTLPTTFNNLKYYPQSLLRQSITATNSIIPLMDTEFFPPTGTVRVGVELINYSTVDYINNDLLLTNVSFQRGFNGTIPLPHDLNGFDGYTTWSYPGALFWPVYNEEQNTKVYECWNRFDVGHNIYTVADGYRQTTEDVLTTDLTVSDAENIGFPMYDFAGYHRTDPVLLLNGTCIGSYIGGTYYCADGYDGVGRQLRGLSMQDHLDQREEVLLSTTGERCVLINRQWTGQTCNCMLPNQQYPRERCQYCFGTGFVVGWQQYFNPRESDRKVLFRIDPTVDDLVPTDAGLESVMNPNSCWGLVVPTVKDRDVIIRFDDAGNEEFRYEILSVVRNDTFLGMKGAQHFSLNRIRKTESIYQIPVFYDASLFPNMIATSITSVPGFYPPHSHTIEISEKITSVNQINQITGISAGHSHVIRAGTILSGETGHSHTIVI